MTAMPMYKEWVLLFFGGIAPITLDQYLIILCVKQGGIKYPFWAFNMIQPGIETRFLEPLAKLYNCV